MIFIIIILVTILLHNLWIAKKLKRFNIIAILSISAIIYGIINAAYPVFQLYFS